MKLVIYRGQKKITVDNAAVPDMYTHDHTLLGFGAEDLQLLNAQITSSMGMITEDGEIEGGINWRQETVN